MDRTLHRFALAGAELVDVKIPDLQHHLTQTINYDQSKSQINQLLASRQELSTLQVQDMEYHPLCHLLDSIVNGPDNPIESRSFCQVILSRVEFQHTVSALIGKHQLDTIIYPTCRAFPPKHEDLNSPL